mgnify:CR=1 FL=1
MQAALARSQDETKTGPLSRPSDSGFPLGLLFGPSLVQFADSIYGFGAVVFLSFLRVLVHMRRFATRDRPVWDCEDTLK